MSEIFSFTTIENAGVLLFLVPQNDIILLIMLNGFSTRILCLDETQTHFAAVKMMREIKTNFFLGYSQAHNTKHQNVLNQRNIRMFFLFLCVYFEWPD